MRILRVIDTLDARTGGPASGVRALTPVLAACGHETVIVTADDARAPTSPPAGATVVPLGPGRGAYRYTSRLPAWLRGHVGAFDVVVVHGLWQHFGLAVHHAATAAGVPYLVYPHGMLDPWFRSAYPGKHVKKWLYWQVAERHVLRDAAGVMFTCEEERRLARLSFAPYACTERVVNYGTGGAPADVEPARNRWLDRHPELAGRRYLLFLGRLHAKKGVDLLLQAWDRLCERRPDAPALVIAGPESDAEEARRLRQLAGSDRPGRPPLIWAGLIEGEMKWGALCAADALVLPSHQENFGLAVAEALAVGTPVLVSTQVNIWREIVADEAGFAAPDTAAGTSQLLERWETLPASERDRMRAHAAACYQRRFHIHAVARSFISTVSPLVVADRGARAA